MQLNSFEEIIANHLATQNVPQLGAFQADGEGEAPCVSVHADMEAGCRAPISSFQRDLTGGFADNDSLPQSIPFSFELEELVAIATAQASSTEGEEGCLSTTLELNMRWKMSVGEVGERGDAIHLATLESQSAPLSQEGLRGGVLNQSSPRGSGTGRVAMPQGHFLPTSLAALLQLSSQKEQASKSFWQLSLKPHVAKDTLPPSTSTTPQGASAQYELLLLCIHPASWVQPSTRELPSYSRPLSRSRPPAPDQPSFVFGSELATVPEPYVTMDAVVCTTFRATIEAKALIGGPRDACAHRYSDESTLSLELTFSRPWYKASGSNQSEGSSDADGQAHLLQPPTPAQAAELLLRAPADRTRRGGAAEERISNPRYRPPVVTGPQHAYERQTKASAAGGGRIVEGSIRPDTKGSTRRSATADGKHRRNATPLSLSTRPEWAMERPAAGSFVWEPILSTAPTTGILEERRIRGKTGGRAGHATDLPLYTEESSATSLSFKVLSYRLSPIPAYSHMIHQLVVAGAWSIEEVTEIIKEVREQPTDFSEASEGDTGEEPPTIRIKRSYYTKRAQQLVVASLTLMRRVESEAGGGSSDGGLSDTDRDMSLRNSVNGPLAASTSGAGSRLTAPRPSSGTRQTITPIPLTSSIIMSLPQGPAKARPQLRSRKVTTIFTSLPTTFDEALHTAIGKTMIPTEVLRPAGGGKPYRTVSDAMHEIKVNRLAFQSKTADKAAAFILHQRMAQMWQVNSSLPPSKGSSINTTPAYLLETRPSTAQATTANASSGPPFLARLRPLTSSYSGKGHGKAVKELESGAAMRSGVVTAVPRENIEAYIHNDFGLRLEGTQTDQKAVPFPHATAQGAYNFHNPSLARESHSRDTSSRSHALSQRVVAACFDSATCALFVAVDVERRPSKVSDGARAYFIFSTSTTALPSTLATPSRRTRLVFHMNFVGYSPNIQLTVLPPVGQLSVMGSAVVASSSQSVATHTTYNQKGSSFTFTDQGIRFTVPVGDTITEISIHNRARGSRGGGREVNEPDLAIWASRAEAEAGRRYSMAEHHHSKLLTTFIVYGGPLPMNADRVAPQEGKTTPKDRPLAVEDTSGQSLLASPISAEDPSLSGEGGQARISNTSKAITLPPRPTSRQVANRSQSRTSPTRPQTSASQADLESLRRAMLEEYVRCNHQDDRLIEEKAGIRRHIAALSAPYTEEDYARDLEAAEAGRRSKSPRSATLPTTADSSAAVLFTYSIRNRREILDLLAKYASLEEQHGKVRDYQQGLLERLLPPGASPRPSSGSQNSRAGQLSPIARGRQSHSGPSHQLQPGAEALWRGRDLAKVQHALGDDRQPVVGDIISAWAGTEEAHEEKERTIAKGKRDQVTAEHGHSIR